ncbi:unnamed protein product [Protopolystoma xenopodis]|uniref:Uncharacterized protein n=1 Tax=Protopolystoma xenopodis TaxID=117903 RepID=A0A448WGZ5_9PLAT|nr:unnamed protein product [Protopolystoma xenopodis]
MPSIIPKQLEALTTNLSGLKQRHDRIAGRLHDLADDMHTQSALQQPIAHILDDLAAWLHQVDTSLPLDKNRNCKTSEASTLEKQRSTYH